MSQWHQRRAAVEEPLRVEIKTVFQSARLLPYGFAALTTVSGASLWDNLLECLFKSGACFVSTKRPSIFNEPLGLFFVSQLRLCLFLFWRACFCHTVALR